MSYPNPHPPGCPWHGIAETFGSPNIKWCEETLCSWISEPANTWSNLGFLLVGALLIRQWFRPDGRKDLLWLGVCVTFMGLMSFIYHAGNVFPVQWLDFLGMFVALGYIIGRHFRTPWPGVAIVTVFSATVIPMYRFQIPYQSLIAILAVPALALELRAALRARTHPKFILISALFFVVAVSATAVDHSRILCEPSQHLLHGHAMWHIFAAVGFWFLAKQWREVKNSD